jgi:TubC N-terminal docking domain
MRIDNLLTEIDERGITLRCGRTEDRLNASPATALTPELIAEIRNHKAEIIRVLREDDALQRTAKIQSERQVFELARAWFKTESSRQRRVNDDR